MNMTQDERDRLIRLESKADYLAQNLEKVAKQQEEVKNLVVEIKEHFEKSHSVVRERLAQIGGALAVVTAAGAYMVKWLLDQIRV